MMKFLALRFLGLVVALFCILQCTGFPLPQQNTISASLATALEADDDPSRLKRYQELGLKQTPVLRVQPLANLHPDAVPSLRSSSVSRMYANSPAMVQKSLESDSTSIQTTERSSARYAPSKGETQGGTPGSDTSTTLGGMSLGGQVIHDNAGNAAPGEFVNPGNSGMSPAAPVPEERSSIRGMEYVTRDQHAVVEGSDRDTPNHISGNQLDAVGDTHATSRMPGATLGQTTELRQAVSQFPRGKGQTPGSMTGDLGSVTQNRESLGTGGYSEQFRAEKEIMESPNGSQTAAVSALAVGTLGNGVQSTKQNLVGPPTGSYV